MENCVKSLSFLSLIVLVSAVCCMAVIPEMTNHVPENKEDISTARNDMDLIDVTDNSSPHVEPTLAAAGGGEVLTHQVTSFNEMTTKNNEVGKTVPGTKVEKPKEVAIWLQALRELEKQNKMSRPNTEESGILGTGQVTDFPRLKGETVKLPPTDQFFKWLDNLPPLQKAAHMSENKNTPETETHSKTDGYDHDTVHKLNIDLHEPKLILFICVPLAAVMFFFILIASYIVYKKKKATRKHLESKIVNFESINRKPAVFQVGSQANIFMGIPANNEIWKDLQMLPPTTSSVMPESKHV